MSDIPRTDTSIYFTEHSQMYDIASEMKKLERELYAANERIKLLEQLGDVLAKIADENPYHVNDVTRWLKIRENTHDRHA